MSWTWWEMARRHEDIWSGRTYRDIAASGVPDGRRPHAEQRAAEVAMSKPFRACGRVGETDSLLSDESSIYIR